MNKYNFSCFKIIVGGPELGKIVPLDVVGLDYELTSSQNVTENCSVINVPTQKPGIHKLCFYSKETRGENGYTWTE